MISGGLWDSLGDRAQGESALFNSQADSRCKKDL